MPLPSQATLEKNPYEAIEARRLHCYAKGDEIPLLPQGVWQVCKGMAQLSTFCPNGEEVLLGWAGPSTYFGGNCITSLQTYRATSLSDIYLRWFASSEIEASPHLSQVLLPEMAKLMRQTQALLAIVGQRRVEDRLRQLLLLLKEEMGQPVAGGTRLSYRLTHQNLASAINTTRVTITRLLGNFQHQGWITIDRSRHIIVIDERFASGSR